ncbi:hypothetical protein U5817_03400 [Aromatoleum evansii]|uniref:Uncharacterized protein n=1 Tax=Aromatoleum evansii TaxID=59406 RepID=A0ABZ1AMM3_AROEV|nr:hypothetical protein U5817_03400 [Aromatoleum evansii]
MASKYFCLVLTPDGLSELAPVLKDYLHEGPIGTYLYCREADPGRNYFHVVAECVKDDRPTIESEAFIPHRFVKVVISSPDRKHIGFL